MLSLSLTSRSAHSNTFVSACQLEALLEVRTSVLCLKAEASRCGSDSRGSPDPPQAGKLRLTSGLPRALLPGDCRSLEGCGRAPDAWRLSHPGRQCPFSPGGGHHPREKEGWVAAVLDEPGPPGILGTPSLSSTPRPRPSPGGKRQLTASCLPHRHQDLAHRTRG